MRQRTGRGNDHQIQAPESSTDPSREVEEWLHKTHGQDLGRWSEYIVVWRMPAGKRAFNRGELERKAGLLFKQCRLKKVRHLQRGRMVCGLVSLPEGTRPRSQADLTALRGNHPDVLAIAPNYRRSFGGVPNDTRFAEMWHHENNGGNGGIIDADMDSPEAWDLTRGSRDVVVAVIDSGIAYDHPDLAPNVWTNPNEIAGNGIDDDGNGYVDDVHGFDFFNFNGNPYDGVGHGTHVAGIIGAVGDNGLGTVGVNQEVSMMALKVGEGFIVDFAAIEAIEYAVEMGARVINASWGGSFPSEPLRLAIEYAGNNGVLFVAAAGNFGADLELSPEYPAAFDLANIVTVSATDRRDDLAGFTNFSKRFVDIAAPGDDILSTVLFRDVFFNENFDGVTPPQLPAGFISDGLSNWATVTDSESQIVLVADPQNHPYPGNVASTLELPTLVPPRPGSTIISFDYALDIGEGDALFFEQRFGEDWFGISLTPTGPEMVQARISVPNVAAPVRFRWVTDGADNDHGGFRLDNFHAYVEVNALEAENANREPQFDFLSGTSMAAPQVTGAIALVLSDNPAASNKEVMMRLLGGADPIAGLADKTQFGRRLNLHRALAPSSGLVLLTRLDGRLLHNSEIIEIAWAFPENPDCPVTVEVLQQGAVVRTLLTDFSDDYRFSWLIDGLDPGDGFQLRLSACDQMVETGFFSVEPDQFVSLEDPQFTRFILDGFDTNEDGRLSHFEAQRVVDMDCSDRGIRRLPDLSAFTSLQVLICRFNYITEIRGIEDLNLVILDLDFNRLESLPARLPATLFDLWVSDNRLTSLPELAHIPNLFDLRCARNRLTELPTLPPSLTSLVCSHNRLTHLVLPGGFDIDLECSHNLLTELPDLTIYSSVNLLAGYNLLEEMPPLPPSTLFVFMRGNRLTRIPTLPEETFVVNFSDNPLLETPDLTYMDSLNRVRLNNANLTEFPIIPLRFTPRGTKTLNVLQASGNRFDATACEAVSEVLTYDPFGLLAFFFFPGDEVDGFTVSPLADGTILACGDPEPLYPVADLALIPRNGAWDLVWSGGAGAHHALEKYKVRVNGKFAGSTTGTRMTLNLKRDRETQIEVKAVLKGEGGAHAAAETFDVGRPEPFRISFLIDNPDAAGLLLAVTNPGKVKQDVDVFALDTAGNVLEHHELSNLARREHREATLGELFSPGTLDGTVLIRLRARRNLEAVLSHRGTDTFTIDEGSEPGRFGTIPVNESSDEIRVAFFAEEPAVIQFKGLSELGDILAQLDLPIEGFLSGSIQELLDDQWTTQIETLTWEANRDVLVTQRDTATVTQSRAWRLSPVRRSSLTGVFPKLPGGGVDFGSSMVTFHNPNDHTVHITLKGYTDTGAYHGDVNLNLAARETRQIAYALLLYDMYWATSMRFRATAPIEAWTETLRYRFSAETGAISDRGGDIHLAQSDTARDLYLPHVPDHPDIETEIWIANLGDREEHVKLRAYDASGHFLRMKTVNIPADGNARDLVQVLFEGLDVASVSVDGRPHAALTGMAFYHDRSNGNLAAAELKPLP